jgi:hypothetical protein
MGESDAPVAFARPSLHFPLQAGYPVFQFGSPMFADIGGQVSLLDMLQS